MNKEEKKRVCFYLPMDICFSRTPVMAGSRVPAALFLDQQAHGQIICQRFLDSRARVSFFFSAVLQCLNPVTYTLLSIVQIKSVAVDNERKVLYSLSDASTIEVYGTLDTN